MSYLVSVLTSGYECEPYLELFLESIENQTYFSNLEIVFIHNCPNRKEKLLLNEFINKYPDKMHVINNKKLETYGASINRAILKAKGSLLAINNVNDIRKQDSIERQALLFQKYPEIQIVYGGHISVSEFGKKKGTDLPSLKFKKHKFCRQYSCGPFPMWRREIHNLIGYYDEQFRSSADYDFIMRAVLNDINIKPVRESLGYFLDDKTGLSTDNKSSQIEEKIIRKRYGYSDYRDLEVFHKENNYDIHNIYYNQKVAYVGKYFSNYSRVINRQNKLIVKLINGWREYYYKQTWARSIIRDLLTKIGVLSFIRKHRQ